MGLGRRFLGHGAGTEPRSPRRPGRRPSGAAVRPVLLPPFARLRLRQRIDGLLEQRAAKERRILALEDRLRVALLPEHDRVVVLESRLKHANRRIIELNEENRRLRT